MTRPASTSRVMLLEDRRGGSAPTGSALVRRYRLARLRFDGAPSDPEKRFEYLKRSYD
ncbi:MAG TPA: hypothetical protein VG275_00910 [Solirubrobacteraceae bacterium]|nr:hypothetical protein [Solirubrobacteraceae bacterium]